MKKFRFDVILSLSVAALCTMFMYQNCAKQKYSQVNTTGVSGLLGTITDDELPVEVVVDNCDSPEDLEKPVCQEDITLKLYVEVAATRSLISTITAAPKVLQDNGTDIVKYMGLFTQITSAYECKKLIVTHMSDIGEVDIASLVVPGLACEEVVDGNFSIDSVVQAGRLFEANGKCTGTSAVNFTGNISSDHFAQAACSSNKFKFCSYSTKFGMVNTINGTQDSKSDSESFTGQGVASAYVTIDESSFNPATRPLMVKGRCTPGGEIVISIYSAPKGTVTCSTAGTWTFSGNVLIPELTNRNLEVSISHAIGTMNINTNIDLASAPPVTIASKVSNTSICKNNAGSVSGACRTGLPIELKVNDKSNAIQKCVGGTYKFDNVLLHKLGVSNKISVHQIQTAPNGLELPGNAVSNITTF